MRFSIIIPVYNVEKYIERCLLSILNQQYSHCEIIVVDDGSKDTSGNICDQIAEKYHNITVIHIPNGGVSNARNTALARARGEYIWFIDSDDYIEDGALELLDSYIEKNKDMDMLIFDAKVVDEEGGELGSISCDLPCGEPMKFEKHRDFVLANTSLWNRIYRAEIIRNKQLLFEENITIAEDLLFNYKYLLECQNVYYKKDALYYYVQRKNSAMSGAGKNKHVQKVFENLISYYKENNQYALYKNEIEYLAIYHYFIVTSVRMIRCGIAKEEYIKIPKWFKENGIQLSLKNCYVRKMAFKHIVIFLLLRLRCYRMIAMLFSKF